MNVQIIIPVYHPDEKLLQLLDMLKAQCLEKWQLLIIDSGSDKAYMDSISGLANARIHDILPRDFNHGATRQWGIQKNPTADIYVFLSQDAILADRHAVANLLKAFDSARVGCAYGRQLPHKDAGRFARIARSFNYGTQSYVRGIGDRMDYGIKTAFLSNSFAAYRRRAMEDVGGFPSDTILSEDMFVAAKMLLKGWSIAYRADARVYHSHNYSMGEETRRYFDIGVFHAREGWIRASLGTAEKTGMGFVAYEISQLRKMPWLLPVMLMRDGMKLAGYRLGLMEKYIPGAIKQHLSMNRRYWQKGTAGE